MASISSQQPPSKVLHFLKGIFPCSLEITYSAHTDLVIKGRERCWVISERLGRSYLRNPTMVHYITNMVHYGFYAVQSNTPSVLGQQPVQTMGQAGHQYNGTQYAAPGMGQPMMPPQPSAGWGSLSRSSGAPLDARTDE
ncbi:hypothetical protein V6N13_042127 [Hibiscus sabdariffa]|uniref:Uncharacterized protein n=1 Tax=Hibiscus sabdariffa TaxID=183260 RepID=A0ABR2DE51_9ROSI